MMISLGDITEDLRFGAGTMGGGIAMVLAMQVFRCFSKEADQAALDRGTATIQLNYANSVKRGRSLNRLLKSRLKRIHAPRLPTTISKRGPGYRGCVRRHGPSRRKSSRNWIAVCKPGASLPATLLR